MPSFVMLYTENIGLRDCSWFLQIESHMLCTNTLCQVMTQLLLLTAKVIKYSIEDVDRVMYINMIVECCKMLFQRSRHGMWSNDLKEKLKAYQKKVIASTTAITVIIINLRVNFPSNKLSLISWSFNMAQRCCNFVMSLIINTFLANSQGVNFHPRINNGILHHNFTMCLYVHRSWTLSVYLIIIILMLVVHNRGSPDSLQKS